MKWIMLLWTSFVSVLIAISAYAWRDMLKTERATRVVADHFRTQSPRFTSSSRHSSAETALVVR
jgi:hypothetical protein